IPDSTTLPPCLTVYFPRMNVLFSSHSYVVVTSRSLVSMRQVPISHSRSFRVSSRELSRSHSWTRATFHWPFSRTSKVFRQLDAITWPCSFLSRRVTSETAESADGNRRLSVWTSTVDLPFSVLKNSAYPFW